MVGHNTLVKAVRERYVFVATHPVWSIKDVCARDFAIVFCKTAIIT